MVNGFYPVDHHPDMAQECRAAINGGYGDAVDQDPNNEKPADALTPTGSELNLNGAAAPHRRGVAKTLLSQMPPLVNGVLSVTRKFYLFSCVGNVVIDRTECAS